MNAKLQLRKYQIVLLQLYAGYRELDNALASYQPRSRTPMWDATGYTERARKHAERELKYLHKRIEYLKRCKYIEMVKEGNARLLKLTSKGTYELLRLRLIEHMLAQKKKQWSRKWWILIFDIPEMKKRYRNFFRRLLKQNGFRMVQRSVWITSHNPEPALGELLKYLGIGKYFELIEADCARCSTTLLKKFKP